MPVLPGTLGERLIELRNQNHLNQRELAAALEKRGLGFFDHATISRAENGTTTRINMELIEALARFYDVTADYILGMTDNPSKKNYEIAELGLSYEAARRLICREVSPDAVNRLLECEEFPLLSDMISEYFPSSTVKALSEIEKLFPEIRGMHLCADELGHELSDAEKKRLNLDLSLLRDPMEIQKDVVQKQFHIVVEEMAERSLANKSDPEPLSMGNNELMAHLRLELMKQKRKADLTRLAPAEQAELIARIIAKRMGLRDDEQTLFTELYKRILYRSIGVTDEKLPRAQ